MRHTGRSRGALLIRPPFFTPMSPPLGLAMMKSFVQQHGHSVRCVDFNVDSQCWAILREYFDILEHNDDVGASSGYSTFWALLNAHLLAYVAGADAAKCMRVVSTMPHGSGCTSCGIVRRCTRWSSGCSIGWAR